MDLHRRGDSPRSDLDRDVHDQLQKPARSEHHRHETTDGRRCFGTPIESSSKQAASKKMLNVSMLEIEG